MRIYYKAIFKNIENDKNRKECFCAQDAMEAYEKAEDKQRKDEILVDLSEVV